jgi:hypothetical protein
MDGKAREQLVAKLRGMTAEQLRELARRCDILHGERDVGGLIALIEAWVLLHGTPSLFTGNELSAAASLEHAQPVDSDRARNHADQEALARFHAMVSDCDHWFLAYSYFVGEAEYGFLWETPYDEIHRKYAGVEAWYDAVGTGICFTVDHVAADPVCHYSTAPGVPITGSVYFIGKKESNIGDFGTGEGK